jgi:hypothetical protein
VLDLERRTRDGVQHPIEVSSHRIVVIWARRVPLLSSTAASAPIMDRSLRQSSTGAGGNNGIGHNKNLLRFPYVFTFLRSHYLHPHPWNGGTQA